MRRRKVGATDGRRVGHVVAVAEARDQRGGDDVGELLGMLSRVWSVCGQSQMENDDRLPFRNALVDLVRVDGHAVHSEGQAPVGHAQTARHRSGSPQARPGCGEMSSGSARLPCTNLRLGLMLEAVETSRCGRDCG